MNKLFDLVGYDGCKHIILSAILTIICCQFMLCLYAALAVLIIGFAKEMYDYKSGKGTAEIKDIICDLIGIILGII